MVHCVSGFAPTLKYTTGRLISGAFWSILCRLGYNSGTFNREPQGQRMLSRLLGSSRYLIVLAVVGSLLGAFVVLVYGFVATCVAAYRTFIEADFGPYGAQRVSVEFIDLIDLFLLATVLYIFALGLYQLFVNPNVPMPPWLHIKSLEHLKEKLLGTVIVLLGVTFLGEVVEWEKGDTTILYLGLAVAPVILAFVLMIWVSNKNHKENPPPSPPPSDQNNPEH
jgi:uncharacterized membrane protein YqhA